CETLAGYHRVSFDTNLSRKAAWVDAFASRVRGDRLYVGMSFHPEFAVLDDFIPKAKRLRDAGADTKVHLICYPPLVEKLPAIYRRLVDEGFSVLPGPFRGEYEGRRYPEAYTERERSLIESMSAGLSNKYKFWVSTQMDPVNPFGKACLAGH